MIIVQMRDPHMRQILQRQPRQRRLPRDAIAGIDDWLNFLAGFLALLVEEIVNNLSGETSSFVSIGRTIRGYCSIRQVD
jgi:hypothetical protein